MTSLGKISGCANSSSKRRGHHSSNSDLLACPRKSQWGFSLHMSFTHTYTHAHARTHMHNFVKEISKDHLLEKYPKLLACSMNIPRLHTSWRVWSIGETSPMRDIVSLPILVFYEKPDDLKSAQNTPPEHSPAHNSVPGPTAEAELLCKLWPEATMGLGVLTPCCLYNYYHWSQTNCKHLERTGVQSPLVLSASIFSDSLQTNKEHLWD